VHLNRFRLVAATVVLGVAMTACAPQPTTPPEAGACQSLALLEASIDAFRALDPATATSADYLAVWSAGRTYYLDLQDYLDQIQFSEAGAVNDAFSDLENAINDLPDDASPADAAAAIQPQLDAAEAALTSVGPDLNC
jgi:hypothetical protein